MKNQKQREKFKQKMTLIIKTAQLPNLITLSILPGQRSEETILFIQKDHDFQDSSAMCGDQLSTIVLHRIRNTRPFAMEALEVSGFHSSPKRGGCKM